MAPRAAAALRPTSGLRDGDVSSPLMLPDLEVGGDEVTGPPPWDDTGDLIGEGERAFKVLRLVRPAGRCMLSRNAAVAWSCSAWTTSAKEMNERRRTSDASSEP